MANQPMAEALARAVEAKCEKGSLPDWPAAHEADAWKASPGGGLRQGGGKPKAYCSPQM